MEWEIDDALFQMHPLQAPGPDGLPALFFQKCWNVVGKEVKNMVLQVLNHEKDHLEFNQTFIVLISKCKKPRSPKEFRPISLCNAVMKLVSKSIANMVKRLIPDIIDEGQKSFMGGRLITDNALVEMEYFYWMKKKKKGKKGVMALKLEMLKAYDRVERSFVVSVLEAMEFPKRMVNLISIFSVVPSPSQWTARSEVFPGEGTPSRRPPIPLPVCFMCKCYLWIAEEGIHLWKHSWDPGGAESSKYFSFVSCRRDGSRESYGNPFNLLERFEADGES